MNIFYKNEVYLHCYSLLSLLQHTSGFSFLYPPMILFEQTEKLGSYC
jgi:hypothetical protein